MTGSYLDHGDGYDGSPRAQARLQLDQYREGTIRYELIPLDAAGEGRGLASLPLPSPGGVFLDLEADIFVGEGGLEYLFGLLIVEDGRPVYREVWAHSLEDEKAAFCSFMDLERGVRVGRAPAADGPACRPRGRPRRAAARAGAGGPVLRPAAGGAGLGRVVSPGRRSRTWLGRWAQDDWGVVSPALHAQRLGLQCSGAIMARTLDETLNDSNMARLAALRRAVATLPLGRS